MKMRTNRILLLILVLIISMGTGFGQTARKEESKDEKAGKSGRDGIIPVVIVKAIERERGRYSLELDAGKTKDGKPQSLARNEKEAETEKKLLNEGSLVDLLGALYRLGYQLESSYAIKDESIVHYHIFVKQGEVSQGGNPNASPSANQNKPRMTPEDLEKRKQQREQPK
jgi:hypothetical protein